MSTATNALGPEAPTDPAPVEQAEQHQTTSAPCNKDAVAGPPSDGGSSADAPAEPEHVDICPTGNVVLVCGAKVGNAKITNIRVSAAVLSMGSKVFEAMFKPHFQEGTQLADATITIPVHIDLPKDEPFGVEVLCKVMHLQNDLIDPNKPLNAIAIWNVAKASDKYQCSAAMKLASFCWLETYEATSMSTRHMMLEAAFYFRDGRAFRNIGRKILEHDSEMCDEIEEIACQVADSASVLNDVFVALSHFRRERAVSVARLAEDQINEMMSMRQCRSSSGNLPACTPQCTFAETATCAFLRLLRQLKLRPFEIAGRQSLARHIHSLTLYTWKSDDKTKPCQTNSSMCVASRVAWKQNLETAFHRKAIEIQNAIKGPCLTCYLENGELALEGCKHYADP